MNIGKKLLSLLTVFCLTLSLIPTVALAADATSVTVDETSIVGSSTTYYKTQKYISGLKSGSEDDYNVKYDPNTHTLTLNNYIGGPIYADGNLTIYLIGRNSITSSSNGIMVGDEDQKNADLTITGTSTATLTLTGANNSTVYISNNLAIEGGVKLTIAGGSSGQAIHAAGGTLTITGSGTEVKATGGSGFSILSGTGSGTINLNDGAKLTADSINGSFKVNGESKTFSSGVTAPTKSPVYTISGTVKDTNGTVVAGAAVQLCTADNVNANALTLIKDSQTDNNGKYIFSDISVGTYTIKVSKTGYNTATKENVTVNDSTPNVSVQTIELSPEIQTYTVKITGTEHMILSSDSGALTQTVNQGSEIKNVVLEAVEGYYFPKNYTEATVDGVAVKRDSYTKITISGTPRANTTINLTSPTEKGTQAALSFSDFSAYDCMSDSNNDGRIEVNTTKPEVEYQKKENPASTRWEKVTRQNGSVEITDLTPGTYLVRYPATDTQNASASWEITILPYTKYNLWVRGIPVTDTNKDDILGDRGTVSYNPGTETLTLENATINNAATPTVARGGTTKSYAERAGIFTTGNLTIHVTGNSSIKSTYGNAIKGKGNLTIGGTGSLTLNSLEDMSSLSLDYDSSTLIIKDAVNITAIVDLSRPLGPGNVSAGISVSAYNTTIQDFANVTAINKGTGWALYSPNNITVKNSAILTAQSKQKGNATSAITYPGHTVTASTTFDGSSSGESTEPYNPTKLNTYKYVKVEPITVTGVELNKDSLSIKVGQSETLSATLQPSGAVQDVTWTSSDDKIVTVTNGTVTAVGVGTATITVTTADGSHTASCTVTVTRASSSGGSHTTYYPVNTPAKSEGGSVVVSPKSASKGSAVTVTVTPESGYQVSSVQAVDKDGKKLTLTDKGDGKYTFVMPGSKVEVSASFAQVQKPEEPSPYRDVSKDSYYYDAVQWASDKGITNGVADGVFAPDWVCTRGQIVTFLWRSVGSPAPKTAEMPFADVAEDAYYAQAVLWAVENGITKGTSETTFSPDQTCTRAHAVAFLYRLAGSPAVTGSSFQDVTADAYYNAAVAWAVQQGITNGTSETTFSPDETCTRAQIVTFLYRMDQAK